MCKYAGKLDRHDGSVDYACVKCNRLYGTLDDSTAMLAFPKKLYTHAKIVRTCPECNAPHCSRCAQYNKCCG